jgi:hypothetical protein
VEKGSIKKAATTNRYYEVNVYQNLAEVDFKTAKLEFKRALP